MIMLLSLLTLAQGTSLRSTISQLELGNFYTEPALPDASYTAYDCSNTETRSVREVCMLCGADLAYTISDPDVAYLEGYYEEDKARIEPILYDFSENLPVAHQYSVAINDTHVCLSASDFVNEVDTEEALMYFAGVEELDMNIPEIFLEAKLTLSFVSIRSNGTIYDYYAIEHNTFTVFQASDAVVLELMYVYNFFENSEGKYLFEGEAVLLMEGFWFFIYTDYERKMWEDFSVELRVEEAFPVIEMAELLDPDANCASLVPPRGISSLADFSVTKVTLDYTYSSEQETMVLDYEKLYFYPPDFAIAPNILLTNITGVVLIEFIIDLCGYEVIGYWDYLDYEILLTVYDNNITSHMEANGYFLNIDYISVEEVSENFFNPLFPDEAQMFPEFIPSDPSILSSMKTRNITNPHIQLFFEPDTSYNIYSDYEGISVEAISSRLDGIIQTVVHTYNKGPGVLKDIGYERVQNDVTFASSDIDIEKYFTMKSMLDVDRVFWKTGVNIEITVEFNDFCPNNAFCGLLQRYAVDEGQELMYLSGYIVNETVTVEKSVRDIELSNEVDFQEVGLGMEYSEYGHLPIFIGAFFLEVDQFTVLRFEGTISQDPDGKSALLESQSYQVWIKAYEVELLTMAGFSLKGNLTEEGEVISSTTLASAFVGDNCFDGVSFNPECLSSSAELLLDFSDYTLNTFSLYFPNITNIDFYNYILGFTYENIEEIPLPMACLELPAGIFIDYQYNGEFSLAGGIMFSGIYGQATGEFAKIGSGTMSLEVLLDDFYFAHENARMKTPVGTLSVDRENAFSLGSISGPIFIWNLNTDISIEISDTFETNFEGNVYQSIYNYHINLIGTGNSKITEALFALSLSLETATLIAQENDLRAKLNAWRYSGLDVVEGAEKKMQEYTKELGMLAAKQCDPELICPTTIYCTDILQEVCTENPIVQECLGTYGCKNVELVCTQTEILCIKADPECKEQCECLSTLEVCKKWTSQCLELSDECKDLVIVKDKETCLKTISTCLKEEDIEIDCKNNCNWNKEVYDIALDMYEIFRSAFNETQEELKGFKEMDQLMSDRLDLAEMAKIERILTRRELSESGIGPYDLEFELEFRVVSIATSQFEDFVAQIKWNFYDDNANQESVMRKAKAIIIENSAGTLTSDLNTKSSKEILEENIV
ncbi:hypothetical protein SteCoe_10825 [Stentor coeruleus]|uniref:Uncharacterized protein n=1 Tax=Stentor coeruleus TaxID=5963 RepID=A0A1R2CEW6_9CILI|nr:hypothetical protein SteCoe_10825 [Stentor coeruleus]